MPTNQRSRSRISFIIQHGGLLSSAVMKLEEICKTQVICDCKGIKMERGAIVELRV